jgi:hypothetical protein
MGDDVKPDAGGLSSPLVGGVSADVPEGPANTPTSNSSPQGGGEIVALTPDEERIKDEGLILILKELHERLDRLVFQAYGWPDTLTDEEILERLVALNAERSREEASGLVRWLRPDYQIPRFAKGAAVPKTEELDLGANVVAIDRAAPCPNSRRTGSRIRSPSSTRSWLPGAPWMRRRSPAASSAAASASSRASSRRSPPSSATAVSP